MMKRIINSRNIRQKVYEVLRDFITSPEIPPGGKINEDDLARQLGVSKTPVREALSKLAHDGMVEIKPNRGAYKVKLSKEDILEIMRIREALDGLCVRLAVANMNDRIVKKLRRFLDDFELKYLEHDFAGFQKTHQQFHALIHSTANSPRLTRLIQGMYGLITMVRLQYFSNPENVKYSFKLHHKLVEAFERKDGESAEDIRKEMLRAAYQYFIELVPEKNFADSSLKVLFKQVPA